MEYKNKRRFILLIALLLLLLLYAFKNYYFMIRVAGFIFGVFVFYTFDHLFNLDFKFRHYVYALTVLTFGILLSPFYYTYPSMDKILHLLMPILGCIFVYFVVDTRTDLEFRWKLLITFMAVVTGLVILELGEYIIDYLWDFKMQGVYLRDITGLEKYNLVMDKNDDTMIDLMLGFAGTLIFVFSKTIIHAFNKKIKKIRIKKKRR